MNKLMKSDINKLMISKKRKKEHKIFFYLHSKTKKVRMLLLFLYLKTIGRLFAYIFARKHPNNEQILFARYMGKHAKMGGIE